MEPIIYPQGGGHFGSMAKSSNNKELDVSIVESLVNETANLPSPSKSIELKANDKVFNIIYNLGLVGKILVNKAKNKNASQSYSLESMEYS